VPSIAPKVDGRITRADAVQNKANCNWKLVSTPLACFYRRPS